MDVKESLLDLIYGTIHNRLTAEALARSQASICAICEIHTGTGWVFFLVFRVSPASIPAPTLRIRTNSQGCEITQTTHAMYV